MRRRLRSRNLWISLFVILWVAVFHYETLRLNYLSPLMGRELPKLKFLYPPAGWIMFFNVDRSYGSAQVYGIRGHDMERAIGHNIVSPEMIDPHEIFTTRFIGYDNIRRNVLISVLSGDSAPGFCRYLHRKFPEYGAFAVTYAVYPDVVNRPNEILQQLVYRCQ